MRKLKYILYSLFHFNLNERRGIFVLLLILTCVSIYDQYKQLRPEPVDPFIIEIYEQNFVAQEETEIAPKVKKKQLVKKSITNQNKSSVDRPAKTNKETFWKPFSFDPNTIGDSLWLNFGLTKKQIKTISNYKKKGGKFYKTEDLGKIYSLNEKDVERIKPFVNIRNSKAYDTKPETKADKKYDINRVSLKQLMSCLQIDFEKAKRIIDKREEVGGFNNLDQLFSFGLTADSIHGKIKQRLYADERFVKKVNVNTLEEYNCNHPMISRALARNIVSYRKEHGPFEELDELLNLALMNEELYGILLPYLIVE